MPQAWSFGIDTEPRMLPPIIVRLIYVLKSVNASDSTLKLENVVIATQLEIVVAIVAATIPCLRPFMNATNTSFLTQMDTVVSSGYGKNAYGSGEKRSKTPQGSALRSLRLGRSNNKSGTEMSQDEIALEPMNGGGEEIGKALGGGEGHNERQEDQQSHGSHDSQSRIIRRDVEWNVRYEPMSDTPGSVRPANQRDDYDKHYSHRS